MSNDVEVQNPTQLVSLPLDAQRLYVLGSSWTAEPTHSQTDRLRQQTALEEISLRDFGVPIAALLEAVPLDVLTVLSIENAKVIDQRCLEAVGRLRYLTTLKLSTTRLADELDFAPIAKLSHLRTIDLSLYTSSLEPVLQAIKSLPLTGVRLTHKRIDSLVVDMVTQFQTLEEFALTAELIEPPTKSSNLSSVRFVHITGGGKTDFARVRDWLVASGVIERRVLKGTIGSFYETGKEEPMREFACSEGGWPLQPGDHLTVYRKDGSIEFQGECQPVSAFDGLWNQKGVDPKTWQKWFEEERPATLNTWRPTGSRQVYLSSAH